MTTATGILLLITSIYLLAQAMFEEDKYLGFGGSLFAGMVLTIGIYLIIK